MIQVEIPGRDPVELDHLVLDLNGTLTRRGELLPGVEERIDALKRMLDVHLASADSFGTLREIRIRLGVDAVTAPEAAGKLHLLEQLGPSRTAHIGNGVNDVAALERAALGIVVLGAEGLSTTALLAADLVYASIAEALDGLLDPQRLTATLRR